MGDGLEKGVVKISESELLLAIGFWVFDERDRKEGVLGAREFDEREAGCANALAEKRCVEIETLILREGGALKRALREENMRKKGNRLARFALVKSESSRKDAGRSWSK